MELRISPQIEAEIEALKETGEFSSREDVVEKAVRLLMAREEKRSRLRGELEIADEQIARGAFVEYTPDFKQQRIKGANKRTRRGLPVNDAVKP